MAGSPYNRSRRESNNPIVFTFYDSLLRLSDIELLRGPCWLNDTIISFYFEFLEIKRFQRNPSLLFVPPQVTQCIKLSPFSEIRVFLEPLITDKCEFIFFALNDNEQTDVSGGSHWSLLVFSAVEKIIFHFDSSKGCNRDQAMEFGQRLLNYLGLPWVGSFKEAPCLQQTNGYDCGVHVLCNAEHIAEYAGRHDKIEGCPMLDRDSVLTKRTEILKQISILKLM